MRKLLLFAVLLPILAWAAAEGPFDGTWKVDLNTVQFPEKSETFLLQKGTLECSTCVPKINVKADGTDQPVTGSKYVDTVAVNVLDDKTIEIKSKKGAKVVGLEKDIVSADGKMLTVEFTSYPEASKQPVTGKVMLVRTATGPAGSHAISGSWRENKAEGISENGLTSTIESSQNGLILTYGTGETFDAKFDGKDYPIKGDAAGSLVSLKKINERSIDQTVKRDGKIVEVDHMTVSQDGKTLLIKVEDRERGRTYSYTAVKQ